MKKNLFTIILLSISFGVFAQEVNIVPKPVLVSRKEGTFQLKPSTKIIYNTGDEAGKKLLSIAQQVIKENSGIKIEHSKSIGETTGNIHLKLNSPFNNKIGLEGYHLDITKDHIFLNANSVAGLFYGIQTISQLFNADKKTTLPCVDIIDYPRFGWRGMHLDVSRHFMPTEFIYKYIDYIAMHKMNVFHWHLVDDQGWRIEIKKYPKLTEVGAWRADREERHWNARKEAVKKNEKKYGGFYTQEEIKAIVAYAQQKNITIVPEIEMPAHVMSALAAYPEFSCTGKYQAVPSGGVWPITHIFCAGKDETFHFLENILSEVMELFPSTFIHIGGDEATKDEWEECVHCQKRIKENNLKDTHELQSYFISRIETFLNKNGRRMIGWDEILEGGLAPEATVMSWRGEKGGISAAKMGHDVVMTPGTHCYFDHYQGKPSLEPLAIGGFTTLKKVYNYEPIPSVLNANEAKNVLGAQANVWTEYMPNGKHVEYMIMPRMAALSEVLWSPQELKNWADFSKRMEIQYKRYEELGINYSNSSFQVNSKTKLNPENKNVNVELSTEAWNTEIRYTKDGSEPTINSSKYIAPLKINKSTVVKTVTTKDGKVMSKPLATPIFIHKAIACPVKLKYANSKNYPASGNYSLVNGIKGTKNYGDKEWLGFDGKDLVATIDLGEVKSLSSVSIGFLQNSSSWIFYPTKLIVEVSKNGRRFKKMGTTKNKVKPITYERLTQDLRVKKRVKAQFIRVTAKSIGTCPKGHLGEGKPAWLFADEIVVK